MSALCALFVNNPLKKDLQKNYVQKLHNIND